MQSGPPPGTVKALRNPRVANASDPPVGASAFGKLTSPGGFVCGGTLGALPTSAAVRQSGRQAAAARRLTYLNVSVVLSVKSPFNRMSREEEPTRIV